MDYSGEWECCVFVNNLEIQGSSSEFGKKSCEHLNWLVPFMFLLRHTCLEGKIRRYFNFFLFFFKFYFIFKLYIIVLVLPNIKMNPPQVYMCAPP